MKTLLGPEYSQDLDIFLADWDEITNTWWIACDVNQDGMLTIEEYETVWNRMTHAT